MKRLLIWLAVANVLLVILPAVSSAGLARIHVVPATPAVSR